MIMVVVDEKIMGGRVAISRAFIAASKVYAASWKTQNEPV
jgi:hypothetical protein